jgi:integrase
MEYNKRDNTILNNLLRNNVTKDESEKKDFDNTKLLFNECVEISAENKIWVNNYIQKAIENKRDKTRKGWGFNRVRYTILKTICLNIFPNKDLKDLTTKDIENLNYGLLSDELLKEDQTKYSESYKARITKQLMESFKFNLGRNKEKFNELFINEFGNKILSTTFPSRKDKLILNNTQIIELITNPKVPLRFAFWFACNFDGGFRPVEFSQINYVDITTIKSDDGKITKHLFKVKEGKNGKSRVVPLTMFPDIIEEYLEGYKKLDFFDKDKSIFPYKEQYLNKIIKKYTKEILKLPNYNEFVNYTLRRSSATHYALYICQNPIKLYSRYGWVMNSPEAQEYVQLATSNLDDDEEQTRVFNSKIYNEDLENRQKELSKELENTKKELKTQNDIFQKQLDNIITELSMNNIVQKGQKEFLKKVDNNEITYEDMKNAKIYDSKNISEIPPEMLSDLMSQINKEKINLGKKYK